MIELEGGGGTMYMSSINEKLCNSMIELEGGGGTMYMSSINVQYLQGCSFGC